MDAFVEMIMTSFEKTACHILELGLGAVIITLSQKISYKSIDKTISLWITEINNLSFWSVINYEKVKLKKLPQQKSHH